jgi:uncharacterized membrane protein HdeD (DUF308 family)
MISVLLRNWWAFVLRGLIAILFGLVALFLPGATMLTLVYVFGAYVMVAGILAIIGAVRSAKEGERWSFLAFEGVIDIVIGALVVVFPKITVTVFVALIAVWALITGSVMLAAAFELDTDHGRWWLALGGLASIVFGVLLVIAPMIGALVLTWWLGAYALVFGVAMLIVAIRLRSKFHALAQA